MVAELIFHFEIAGFTLLETLLRVGTFARQEPDIAPRTDRDTRAGIALVQFIGIAQEPSVRYLKRPGPPHVGNSHILGRSDDDCIGRRTNELSYRQRLVPYPGWRVNYKLVQSTPDDIFPDLATFPAGLLR